MPEEIIRTLSADGVRYGYRVLPYDRSGGAAPRTEPTLILGGALQGMFGWPQMDDHLGPATDVVTADLPGMGGADPLPPGPSADLLRRAVLGIADDLGAPGSTSSASPTAPPSPSASPSTIRSGWPGSRSAGCRSTSTPPRSPAGSGPGGNWPPGTARASPPRRPTR